MAHRLPNDLLLKIFENLSDQCMNTARNFDLVQIPPGYFFRRTWPIATLKACALVCKNWLESARKALYSSIRLNFRHPTSLSGLLNTLEANLYLASLVKAIFVQHDSSESEVEKLLRLLPNVRQVVLQGQCLSLLDPKALSNGSIERLALIGDDFSSRRCILADGSTAPLVDCYSSLARILAEVSPNLEYLYVTNFDTRSTVTRVFPSLRSVYLGGSIYRGPSIQIDPGFFKGSPLLDNLEFDEVDPEGLQPFLTALSSQIRTLNLFSDFRVMDNPQWTRDILASIPHLETFFLYRDFPLVCLSQLPLSLRKLNAPQALSMALVEELLLKLAQRTFLPDLQYIPHIRCQDDTAKAIQNEDRWKRLQKTALNHLRKERSLPFTPTSLQEPSIWNVVPHQYLPDPNTIRCGNFWSERAREESARRR